VPTDDGQVRAQLRELGEPICLFGERPADRRERLRNHLAELEVDSSEKNEILERLNRASAAVARERKKSRVSGIRGDDEDMEIDEDGSKDSKFKQKTFYTSASAELIEARKKMCEFSWKRAKDRLDKEREQSTTQQRLLEADDEIIEFEEKLKHSVVEASQVGDRRPLTCCAVAKHQPRMVTGAASGWVRVWDRHSFEHVWTMADHKERVVDVATQEQASGAGDDHFLVATASADCTAKIWQVPLHTTIHEQKLEKQNESGEDVVMKSEPGSNTSINPEDVVGADEAVGTDQAEAELAEELAKSLKPTLTLEGHLQRLSRVAWHPMGSYVGTSSYDQTWRLWDIEMQKELLMQEGHDAAVYAFGFHPDGSLTMSGDLAGVVRLWDLRSGKSIQTLMGHAGQVLAADFSVNGYLAATGSSDNSARVWDLRTCKTLHTLPGHMSIVRDVRFDPLRGAVLATSSYDCSCKLWDAAEGLYLTELRAHDKMVTGVAWSPSSDSILTCSYDRTWKMFAPSAFGSL